MLSRVLPEINVFRWQLACVANGKRNRIATESGLQSHRNMRNRTKGMAQTAVLPMTRMYPAELAAIKQAAKQANLSLAQYIRNKLLPDGLPVSSQSTDIIEASLSVSPPLSSAQTPRNQRQNSIPTQDSKTAARQLEQIVSRKTSHKVGCDCVQCERIRRMIGKPSA